jgi:gamma-glutamylcyclotransferase (GGCT)/AIG2-like uncharacterized protein YtfP
VADKCLIFTYGMLQPGASPPRTASNFWRDRLKAAMFDLGPYPVAIHVGTAPDYIDGFVVEIDADELTDLDDFEDTDSGEFVRKTATTEQGYEVYVYEYGRPVPAGTPRVSIWKPPG